jgi:hypothetical protein
MIAATPPLAATELYSWHSLDSTLVSRRGLEVILHARLRSRDEMRALQQARAGSIVRWTVAPRATLFGGYYYQPVHEAGTPWGRGHRGFAGVESPLARWGSGTLTGRLAFERHLTRELGAYNRYRSYLRWQWERSVSPYFQSEWLAVREGFHSTRTSGGLRWQATPTMTIEVGYLYDVRRTAWGGDRQAVVTSVRFHRGRE